VTPGQRKLAAILAADVVGFSRLAGVEEELTLARLRALGSDLIDPLIAVHRGRVVKRSGDGVLVEFRSVVDAVRCAVEIQTGMVERNAGVAAERQIRFRIGIHLGDVVEESDGDLMGDGVNIAARLEGIAEPGGICLSEDAYRQVRDKIDASFADLGERELKNIARPVRVYAIELSSPSRRKPGPIVVEDSPGAGMDPGFRRGGEKGHGIVKGGPPRLSIVVLPFANIGGDPEQEYFVDGVTESLTTDLSRIAGSFVIARNTAFTFKGKPVDVKQIGRDLNVRYVLEGSVQRGGNRVRVNVQLIDAETGNHLWAERFDKPLTDLFDMQDEIVARLANQLDTQLVAAEARRAERAPHPDSMDLYFQGMACVNRGWTAEYLGEARGHFERALELDPGNLEALVGTAFVDATLANALQADNRSALNATAEAILNKVLSLAPEHALAHLHLGGALIFSNRAIQGIAECERALALDRNLAAAYTYIGVGKYGIGRAEETEGHILETLRLSPRDSRTSTAMVVAAMAKLSLGRDDEAIEWSRRAIETNRNYAFAHFFLAAALGQLGRWEEARAAVQTGLSLDPTFTISRYRAGASNDNPAYLAGRERIYDGMRKAGVPEG
jgi:TolB-like protein/class 3 adenylate cyclase